MNEALGFNPKAIPDFRKSLEDKDVDLLVVAALYHWYIPAAILAYQAGKEVCLANPAQALDSVHIQNLFSNIREGVPLNSDNVSGHISTLLCQLGNIAQLSGDTLNVDPSNGHILKNKAANKFWSREYEKGWEPKV
ncbi:hypothetical protein [Cyclobacterium qasimii]|uniref:Myo-inositol 2-dehydrogenase n=2 Tax=Cyclobacterium qasimii TaxID=1350429 RepID=S7VEE3_9BACT|nr:hypothetical protein [Cyclobacterium qasimii]EPR67917.1 Myo-inositol 2-dehydrogenase [Cyclobacterium qasimii M12-11B]GEO23061.1 hypothetical protein CQA01_35950 [Cyclobacterium qasimii]